MRRNWTRTEVEAALALYLRLDFGKFHSANPDIIELAARIGRTPSAVEMKLSNLAALDDSLPQKGLASASKLDREIWQSFLRDPTRVIQHAAPAFSKGGSSGFAERQAIWQEKQSTQTKRSVDQREGQQFFREMILTSYQRRCALTGIEDTRLLVASHIVGWAEDQGNRLNPKNGICLNALHDRAFDRHLITFDDNLTMKVRNDVPDQARRQLERIDQRSLTRPGRFPPDQDLLERHRKEFHRLQAA
jgi:predicted restriction endonuclease